MTPADFFHNFAQAWVLVTSSAAVYCIARTDRWNRWGYVLGLASEPAWLYAAWVAQQWGTLLLTVWWSYYWGVGAWRRFRCGYAPAAPPISTQHLVEGVIPPGEKLRVIWITGN